MTILAEIPLSLEPPHALILFWLGAGCLALWIAQRLQLPRQKSVNILLPMALGLVIFTLYVGTRFNYDFLIDDIDIVQTNPDVVEADGWINLWTNDYWSGRSTDDNLYRPVTIFSYWVNARLPLCGLIVDGKAIEIYPRYFRGVNIVLLTLLAWLIALWLGHYVQPSAAWCVAFLFAGHAVHAEMVNYVVCRADLLAMLGVVGFLYMQRLAIEAGRWRWWSAAIALISAGVAVGSKESGFILFPAALAQAWIGQRHANTEITDDQPTTPLAVTVGWALLLLVPIVCYAVARTKVVGVGFNYTSLFMDDMRDNPLREIAPTITEEMSWLEKIWLHAVAMVERLPAALAIAWFYFKQIFVPDTSYYHIPAQLPSWSSGDTIRGLTLLVVLGLLLVAWLRRHRWQAIAIVLALGQFLIVGNLLAPVGVYAANRLILPFTLAGAILAAAFIHWFCGTSPRRRAVVILPTIAVICVMAFETQEVNHVWRTESRLIGRDRTLAPTNPVTRYNFGTVRAREGIAVDKYLRALKVGIELTDKLASTIHQPGAANKELAQAVKRLIDEARRELHVPLETNAHLEQTKPLRDVLALVERTFAQDIAVLTSEDIDAAGKKLREEQENAAALSTAHWDTALLMLELAVTDRPESMSARIEWARTLELRDMKEEARVQYRELVNIAKQNGGEEIDRDMRVIESRVRYGKLCIDLSRDKEGAEKSLAIAELMLATLIQEPRKLAPGQLKDLHALNRSTKRYLGVLAWKDNRIKTAIKRHSELLKQYPDFKEAKDDLAQWIDQQTPPDARDPDAPPT